LASAISSLTVLTGTEGWVISRNGPIETRLDRHEIPERVVGHLLLQMRQGRQRTRTAEKQRIPDAPPPYQLIFDAMH
jgi:hypothetical protein